MIRAEIARRFFAAVLALSITAADRLEAATLTWDTVSGDGATLTDGLGNWSNGGGNWNLGGVDALWSNTAPDTAIFGSGGTAGVITLTSAITVDDITFNALAGTDRYLLQSATASDVLTLAGAGTPALTANTDATINAILAGTAGLTKFGTTGILTLGGNNTLAGNITVDGGGLRLTHSNALGTLAKTVFASNNVRNPHYRLDGSGGDVVIPATISFSTSNDTNQGTIINEAGNNSINGNFSLTTGGGGTTLNVLAGTLTLNGNITSNATGRLLTLRGAGNGTLNGILSASGANALAVTKSEAGTWTMTNSASSYTGATTINAGTLSVSSLADIGSNSAIGRGNGTSDATNAASLVIGTSSTLLYTGGAVSTDRLFTIGTGTVTLNASGTGPLQLTNTGALAFTGSGARTLALGGTNTGLNTLSAAIGNGTGGNVALTIAGTSVWVLAGDNSYSGSTSISNNAILRITSNNALGNTTGSTTINSNNAETGRLELAGGITSGENILISGRSVGDAIRSISGVNTLTGAITITTGGGSYTFQSESGSTLNLNGTVSNPLNSSRIFTFTGSGNGVVNGVIQQTGTTGTVANVSKTGTGTWTLANANTYTGTTTVGTGTLLATNTTGSATGSGTVTVNSGAFLGGNHTGEGNISGPVTMNGNISPGSNATAADNGIGVLKIGGNITFGSTSTGNILQLASHGYAGSVLNANGTINAAYLADIANRAVGSNDRLEVGGTLNIGTNNGVNFRVTLADGYVPYYGDAFDLLDWGTLSALTNFNYGAIGTLRNGGTAEDATFDLDLPALTNGWKYNMDYFLSNGVIVVVPEPGRFLLVGAGVLLLAMRRRR